MITSNALAQIIYLSYQKYQDSFDYHSAGRAVMNNPFIKYSNFYHRNIKSCIKEVFNEQTVKLDEELIFIVEQLMKHDLHKMLQWSYKVTGYDTIPEPYVQCPNITQSI